MKMNGTARVGPGKVREHHATRPEGPFGERISDRSVRDPRYSIFSRRETIMTQEAEATTAFKPKIAETERTNSMVNKLFLFSADDTRDFALLGEAIFNDIIELDPRVYHRG